MASMAWSVVRTVTVPTLVAAIGITSGVLLLFIRKLHARLSRMECRERSLRREVDCRLFAQRMWTADNERARELLSEE